ncbi:protein melted [Phlebotomus papatasi]|uniref:protein melted n=1 Tax=Phlebotomus papatasi TaxID=29031 RepID=UPI002483C011|nr:protein melted [Phlebotomus papatasi]XP_055704211.1 protein melted [Phlebotomus papatasi]
MHELFVKVLTKRDLSRAGDLFSVADVDIVNDLTDVLTQIELIISQADYLQNKNDQSVMEICVTRVTSCIRETKTVERHCPALVSLLDSCLKQNLQPLSGEDPPHAKISADLISSIFLNYNKKTVMEMALPVAVKFLQKGNKELAKNLASYLSLAAIEYAYLLSPHVQSIIDSILAGNYGLCQILPQIYEVAPHSLDQHTLLLISLLNRCDTQEKLALLQLFALIAKNNPSALEDNIPHLCESLQETATVSATLNVLLKLAEEIPSRIHDHFDNIKIAAEKNPQTVALASQVLATSGKINRTRAQFALDFVLQHLPHADRTSQTILLREATMLCSTYPILFTDKVLACVRQRNNTSQQSSISTSPSTSSASPISGNQMSGGVTIVKLNVVPVQTPVSVTSSGNSVTTTVINSTSNGTATVHVPPQPEKTSHVVTIPTSTTSQNSNNAMNGNTVVSPPHTGYTRRAKLGDSRSTGRLHSTGNTHRSMTRLNIAGGSVGGLHKSMTRLSSSQQINQQQNNTSNPNNVNTNSSGSVSQINGVSATGPSYVTPVPPLSSNVIITGHNKWGIPSTKITSGGVTVTTSPPRGVRPHSQGLSTLLGSSGGLGSITSQSNSVSVQHASPAPSSAGTSSFQQSVMTLPINTLSSNAVGSNQVSVSGPVTVTSRRNDNTSITLLNANHHSTNQRMSVFEPCPERDTIQHFSEKHFDKIKVYIESVEQRLPPAAKCTIEERRSKKFAKLHFACQARGPHCLYSKTFFTMRTRNPKTWIHLMFLDQQSRAQTALSSRDPAVSSLRHCWDILKCENKSFVTLATSAFPSTKDTDALVNELRNSGFFDVFELGPVNGNSTNGRTSSEDLQLQWGCFLCNHPEKAMGFLQGNTQPVIEGQLKEKKGKWRLFRRWRTRYFTLSGAHLSCKGSSGGESIDINQIRSLKVSRGARNIPKAFEIFTGDQTLILKPKDGKNAEEWVQCLSIVVATSQARDQPSNKTNSLPARSIGNSRTAF